LNGSARVGASTKVYHRQIDELHALAGPQ
jgi:hypothetical protein